MMSHVQSVFYYNALCHFLVDIICLLLFFSFIDNWWLRLISTLTRTRCFICCYYHWYCNNGYSFSWRVSGINAAILWHENLRFDSNDSESVCVCVCVWDVREIEKNERVSVLLLTTRSRAKVYDSVMSTTQHTDATAWSNPSPEELRLAWLRPGSRWLSTLQHL